MAQVTITQVYSAHDEFQTRHELFLEEAREIIGDRYATIIDYSVIRGRARGETEKVTHSALIEID